MDEEKNIENQEVVTNKDKWNDNFSQRHADIDPSDEEAYFGAINDDYAAYDEKIKGYEEDNKRIADMLAESPALANMLVAAHNGGNPWKVLAQIGGESLIELMKNPEDEELAQNVLDGMNEYAEKVKANQELEKEASENIGPTIDNMLSVVDKNGMNDEQANQMYELWESIRQDSLVNKCPVETWELLAKAVMHDENISAAETEGEMRGKNAKMQVEKNHIIKGASPSMLRGQGGGPREENAGKQNQGFQMTQSIWDRDNENEY